MQVRAIADSVLNPDPFSLKGDGNGNSLLDFDDNTAMNAKRLLCFVGKVFKILLQVLDYHLPQTIQAVLIRGADRYSRC